jgi:hypothetical protein
MSKTIPIPNDFTLSDIWVVLDAMEKPDTSPTIPTDIPAALLRELKSAVFYIESYGGEVTGNFAAGGNLDYVKRLIAAAEGVD